MKPVNNQLHPRKKPSQLRSAQTVQKVLDCAAHILETEGLEAYSTKGIAARSEVSIGSLYQYFACRDAITISLIESQAAALAEESRLALTNMDFQQALAGLIDVAVHHQLHRPQLARRLDLERARLAPTMPTLLENSRLLQEALSSFLINHYGSTLERATMVATDMLDVIRALTLAAGRRKEVDAIKLSRTIQATLVGYMGSLTQAAGPCHRDDSKPNPAAYATSN